MFDDLQSLDDATPPTPDAAMLEHVHGRADRRRTRNRLTVAGACIVSLAVVVGAVVVLRDDGRKINVVNPAPSTTSPSPTTTTPDPVSEGTLANGLHVRLTLETPIVVRGDSIRAHVEVRNDTSVRKIIGIGSIECVLNVRAVVQDVSGRGVAGGHNPACYAVGHALEPGASVSVTTTLSTDSVNPGTHYQFGLESYPFVIQPGPFLVIPPIPVRIDAPELSGRIDLAKTTYAPGAIVDGTLVIENHSNSPVHYTLECFRRQPWRMVLAKGTVHFDVAETTIGCTVQPEPPPATLPPGPTTFPFTVELTHPSCVSSGPPSVAEPECVGLAVPPLAPGDYQIDFEGFGPLASVEVAPVPIRVVALGTG